MVKLCIIVPQIVMQFFYMDSPVSNIKFNKNKPLRTCSVHVYQQTWQSEMLINTPKIHNCVDFLILSASLAVRINILQNILIHI
jgi:hypothetical protein